MPLIETIYPLGYGGGMIWYDENRCTYNARAAHVTRTNTEHSVRLGVKWITRVIEPIDYRKISNVSIVPD